MDWRERVDGASGKCNTLVSPFTQSMTLRAGCVVYIYVNGYPWNPHPGTRTWTPQTPALMYHCTSAPPHYFAWEVRQFRKLTTSVTNCYNGNRTMYYTCPACRNRELYFCQKRFSLNPEFCSSCPYLCCCRIWCGHWWCCHRRKTSVPVLAGLNFLKIRKRKDLLLWWCRCSAVQMTPTKWNQLLQINQLQSIGNIHAVGSIGLLRNGPKQIVTLIVLFLQILKIYLAWLLDKFPNDE